MFKKRVIFSLWNPPEEFLEFIKSLGYKEYPLTNECLFDERVVEFVENHANWKINRDGKIYNLYKGRENFKFRVGFEGIAYTEEIDISKNWRIVESNSPIIGFPIVKYMNIIIDEYGMVKII